MTTLRHQLSPAIAGHEARVSPYLSGGDAPAQGSYEKLPSVSAVSDASGALQWTLPPFPGHGTPTYVVTGIEAAPVLVRIPAGVSTTTVTVARIATLDEADASAVDLVTEDELTERLSDVPGLPTTDTEREQYIPARLSDASLRAAFVTATTPALRTWHAALANRNYAPAKVALIGDSVTEGFYSTSAPTRRWSDLLRDRLRAKFPSTGPGSGGGIGWLPRGSFYDPWTQSGGAAQTSFGFGRYSFTLGTGNTASITVTGTTARVLFTEYSGGGTFSWSVDGAAATNVPTDGTAQDNTETTVPLGTSGSHTLTLTGVSGTCIINGAMVLDGDESAGIWVYNGGHSAYGTDDFVAKDPAVPTDTVASFCATEQPQLVVIALGINDWLFQRGGVTSATTYGTNMQTLIDQINANTTASIALMMLYKGGTTAEIAAANPDGWQAYIDQAGQLAANNGNVSVLDLSQRFPVPSVDNSLGLAYTDLLHLSDKGSSYVADLLVEFLSPR